jgi:hypothetical protein
MLELVCSLLVSSVSSVITDGSSSLKCSCRTGKDLSILYILTCSLSKDIEGGGFILSKDDDSDFSTCEASLWKIFVLIVYRIKICNP